MKTLEVLKQLNDIKKKGSKNSIKNVDFDGFNISLEIDNSEALEKVEKIGAEISEEVKEKIGTLEKKLTNASIDSVSFDGSQTIIVLSNGHVIKSKIVEDTSLTKKEIESLAKSLIEESNDSLNKRLFNKKKNVNVNDILKIIQFIEDEIGFISKKIDTNKKEINTKVDKETSVASIRTKIETSFTQEKLDAKFIKNLPEYKDKKGIIGGNADPYAIHKNRKNEISSIAEKTSLHNDDIFIIEDSENLYVKKKVKSSNILTSPAGSDGYVQFNDNGSFGADSSFRWDKTKRGLDLGHKSAQNQPFYIYADDTDTAYVLASTGSGKPLILGGTSSLHTRLRFDYNRAVFTNGNVGIGIDTPLVRLDVLGSHLAGTGMARFKGVATGGFITVDTTQIGEAGVLFKSVGTLIGQIGVRKSDNAVYIKNIISGASDLMTFASDGNVGIGTDTPLAKLHINGGTGSLATGIAFGVGNSGIFEIIDGSLTFYITGGNKWHMSSTGFYLNHTQGPEIYAGSLASSIIPNFIPNRSDLNTGIGWAGLDQGSLIAGGVEVARFGDGTNPKLILNPDGAVGGNTGLWFGGGLTGLYEVVANRLVVQGINGRFAFGLHDSNPWFKLQGATGATYWSFQSITGDNVINTQTRDFEIRSTLKDNAFFMNATTGFIGFGTNAPHSLLDVRGSVALACVEKTSAYTFTSDDYHVEQQTSGVTDTLLSSTGVVGRIYVYSNTSGGSTTLQTTSSETIYTTAGTVTSITVTDGQSYILQARPSGGWKII